MSSSQRPMLGSKIPRFATPALFQSPTTGRSPAIPKGPRHLSTVQSSHCPLPLRSRNHWPVLGRKSPGAAFPLPSQSPTTARSPVRPNDSTQPSVAYVSQRPFSLRSRCQVLVVARKTAIPVPNCCAVVFSVPFAVGVEGVTVPSAFTATLAEESETGEPQISSEYVEV